MPNMSEAVTDNEISGVISNAHFEGQGGLRGRDSEGRRWYVGWPISRGGAAHVGDAAAQMLLMPGVSFARLAASKPSEANIASEVRRTWGVHRVLARIAQVAIPTSVGRLGRLLPGQNITTTATALWSWRTIEKDAEVDQVRLLRPGDPDFERLRERLDEDPRAREWVALVMRIANLATTTGRGLDLSLKYQAAHMGVKAPDDRKREFASKEFPVELIVAGRAALREKAAEGEKSIIFDLVRKGLIAAGLPLRTSGRVAYALVAPMDPELIDMVTPKPRPK